MNIEIAVLTSMLNDDDDGHEPKFIQRFNKLHLMLIKYNFIKYEHNKACRPTELKLHEQLMRPKFHLSINTYFILIYRISNSYTSKFSCYFLFRLNLDLRIEGTSPRQSWALLTFARVVGKNSTTQQLLKRK